MSGADALPLQRYWLASGAALGHLNDAIDPPPWPLNAVRTIVIATDEAAIERLAGRDHIDGRGLSIGEAIACAGLPSAESAYLQIVDAPVRDFVPGLQLFADILAAARPAIARAALLRIGEAASALVESGDGAPPAAHWIRSDRLGDFLARDGSLSERIATFRKGDVTVLDERLVIGGHCAADDDPTGDSILAAKCAAAIAAADRLRYEKRRTQRANRILRQRNERLKAELEKANRRGLLARLFGRR